jgi:dTDP-4-dehydrorhamnose 3,5-epimerase
MRFSPTHLKGVVLIEPEVHKDARGFFMESYHAKRYQEAGLSPHFVQDNHSRSVQGTLRGLHAQLRHPQGKLIKVILGEIFDVAVDARPDSATYGEWTGEVLSAENFLQLYIPPGFLHGFYVTSPVAEVEYKCTDYYDAKDEVGVIWNDSRLNIKWPVSNPVFISEKDQKLPAFNQAAAQFELYRFKKG